MQKARDAAIPILRIWRSNLCCRFGDRATDTHPLHGSFIYRFPLEMRIKNHKDHAWLRMLWSLSWNEIHSACAYNRRFQVVDGMRSLSHPVMPFHTVLRAFRGFDINILEVCIDWNDVYCRITRFSWNCHQPFSRTKTRNSCQLWSGSMPSPSHAQALNYFYGYSSLMRRAILYGKDRLERPNGTSPRMGSCRSVPSADLPRTFLLSPR